MSSESSIRITIWDIAWAALTVLSFGFQLYVLEATPLDLAPDEAHYWEWSRRIDWAYYSKGPVVALLIHAGTWLFGDTAFGVRFFAAFLSNAMLLVLYLAVRTWYSPQLALWAWLSTRTMLLFVSHGFAMTTDPSTALAWLLAIVAARAAIVRSEAAWWIPAFLSIGLGGLGKYTTYGLYPSLVLLLVLTPALRWHLRTKGFWFGSFWLSLSMLPVVLWNLQNGWVNVAHNAAHLSAKSEALVSLKFFLELLVGQLGLVGPLFLVACVYGLWRSFVFWRRGDEVAGLYVWSSLPLAVLCIGTSFVRRVYANWPMPIYIGGTLCLARLVYLYAVAPGRAESWARWSIGINTCVSALAFCIVLGFSMPLPGNILPTKKLVGWAELGQEIDKQRASFQAADSNDLPVIAADYGTASAIAFYSLSRPKVMCAVSGHRRMNQYDVWGGWEELEGMDALVVLKNDEHRQELSKMFSSFSPLGTHPNLEVFHHRTRIRGFQFYLGRDYIGGVPSTPNRR